MSADAPTTTTKTEPHHINPFHHAHGADSTPNDGTPADGSTRRRSSAAEIVHKIGHSLNEERKSSQAAFETFYRVDAPKGKGGEDAAAAQAVKNVEKEGAK